MTVESDSSVVFEAVLHALHDANLAFMLVGANAFGAYTLPRATYDLDFLVEDPGRPLDSALPRLSLAERSKDVYFDQEAYIFEIPTRVTPVEMFVATHWLTKQALNRREEASFRPFGQVPIARPDDLLLLKAAVASHPARSPLKRATDIQDMGRLLDAAPRMDEEYVRENARRLGAGVAEILREAGFQA